MLLQNNHIKKPIDLLERLMEKFKEDIFRGGRRPTNRFYDALTASLDVKAHYLGDPSKQRRRKGGAHASDEGFIFPEKGKPSDHSRYIKQGKLFALEQARWLMDRLDQSKFPSFHKTTLNNNDVLDALKSDLTEDITGNVPVATVNYDLLLQSVSIIYTELDKLIKNMPSAKAILAERWKVRLTSLIS